MNLFVQDLLIYSLPESSKSQVNSIKHVEGRSAEFTQNVFGLLLEADDDLSLFKLILEKDPNIANRISAETLCEDPINRSKETKIVAYSALQTVLIHAITDSSSPEKNILNRLFAKNDKLIKNISADSVCKMHVSPLGTRFSSLHLFINNKNNLMSFLRLLKGNDELAKVIANNKTLYQTLQSKESRRPISMLHRLPDHPLGCKALGILIGHCATLVKDLDLMDLLKVGYENPEVTHIRQAVILNLDTFYHTRFSSAHLEMFIKSKHAAHYLFEFLFNDKTCLFYNIIGSPSTAAILLSLLKTDKDTCKVFVELLTDEVLQLPIISKRDSGELIQNVLSFIIETSLELFKTIIANLELTRRISAEMLCHVPYREDNTHNGGALSALQLLLNDALHSAHSSDTNVLMYLFENNNALVQTMSAENVCRLAKSHYGTNSSSLQLFMYEQNVAPFKYLLEKNITFAEDIAKDVEALKQTYIGSARECRLMEILTSHSGGCEVLEILIKYNPALVKE